ncbi:hypothetical protein ACFOSO_37505, partial [Planomonospora venezuelensis]
MAVIEGRTPVNGHVIPTPAGTRATAAATRAPAAYAWAAARIALGWVFLWAFADKTFGLGFATPAA